MIVNLISLAKLNTLNHQNASVKMSMLMEDSFFDFLSPSFGFSGHDVTRDTLIKFSGGNPTTPQSTWPGLAAVAPHTHTFRQTLHPAVVFFRA